jgi:LacI family transcriptional regulator
MADPQPSPTMTDIARRAGVSKNTVSLALRNDPRLPETTRRRIRKLATEMGYQKDATVAHLMSRLRSRRSKALQASIALLNANRDPVAFARHPTIPAYVEGCRRRAEALGYAIDDFWMHDPSLDGERLSRILRARGIRGVVIVGLMHENQLPERFRPVWDNFATVVTGVRTRDPSLSFACSDHHMLTLRAFENALALGYKRPAMVLDQVIDRLTEGRFTAGMLIAQQSLPAANRLAAFYKVREARQDDTAFRKWFEHQRPDVILTLYHDVRRWLTAMGLGIPADVGLVQMEWRKDHSDWAGMDQHNDFTGEAAMEMLISMIHNGERGEPAVPRATLVGATWIDGSTVKGSIREPVLH